MKLERCPKTYVKDQDKAVPPSETVARVRAVMEEKCPGVLAETDRVDTGRLGIPVFVSVCGPEAARVMPTRKQMGKGASPEQAEASALMELVERYSYFSFKEAGDGVITGSYSDMKEAGRPVLPMSEILKSVGEEAQLDEERAELAFDLVEWDFVKATRIADGEKVLLPVNWFRLLNEFNGSSAGNTSVESVLQGACELVERHVCAVVDRTRPELPTIDPTDFDDPVLADLMACFEKNGIKVILKDFTLGFPVPTVAALAWDPSTFPGMSEIVFTAGTSASPAKAAIRALTEVAQLGGDFHTGRIYEASGLPKFTDPAQFAWLEQGPLVGLETLPTVEEDDIYEELLKLARGLGEQGYNLYSVDLTRPELSVPANYNIVPGFLFRERTPNASLGVFVGRMLAEESEDPEAAALRLLILESVYIDGYFISFFKGLLALRRGEAEEAVALFAESEPLQPADEERGLAAFYQAHALTLMDRWDEAVPHLDRAIGLDPEVQEAFNLRGVARFKAGKYEAAGEDFQAALNLDSGQPQILANLGMCRKRLGDLEGARHFLAAALNMDASLSSAEEALAEIGQVLGE